MSITEPDQPAPTPVRFVAVMGVAGSGKTTIGQALAEALNTTFIDGDDYHPRANVEKMGRGEALSDHDRWPWLNLVMGAMRGHVARNEQQIRKAGGAGAAEAIGCSVAACSALRRPYRDFMSEAAGEPIFFAHLHGAREIMHRRLMDNEDHFMPSQQLDTQLATLEHLGPNELGLTVDVALPVEEIIRQLVREIQSTDLSKVGQPA
ncbi:MAG: gluconokinase [Burkholderiaceae bacterium]